MNSDFRRIAIVNRGEAALRLVKAVREWNAERGDDLVAIALVTEPDRRSLFAREAHETHDLGPALVPAPGGGRRSAYVDHARVAAALRATGAEAVWTGWGFVAEDPVFAELVEWMGLVLIGPRPEAMRRLGDKVAAKRLAESLGIRTVPWSGGAVGSPAEAAQAAERIGFPVMVKASAGGGGRGMRRVERSEDLAAALASAAAEASRSFGSGELFLEKVLEPARHVEVQVAGDLHGTTWAVGTRDCTLQRRHQKVVEEAPASCLSPSQQAALCDAALRLAREAAYSGLGTVEFLLDPTTREASFIEVNARLQVEHTVTEMVTGLDLVKLQLEIARGGRLASEPPAAVGHAIEARINAEDPDEEFAPAPGRLELFRLPTGPGLRIDRGFTEGDRVPAEFDPLIAKVIAHGRTREEALGRLQRALSEAAIVVRGGASNRALLLELAALPELRQGAVDVSFLERHLARRPPRPHGDLALVQAAIEASEAERRRQRDALFASAARLRPELPREAGRAVELRQAGRSYRVRVRCLSPGLFRVEVGGARVTVQVETLSSHERRITCGGRRHRAVSVIDGSTHLVEIDGVPHRFSRDDLGVVRAPSPAVVVQVSVQAGDEVVEGQPLLTLEAMKMETQLVAPFAGRVRQVSTMPNAQVMPGAPLLQLDAEPGREPAGERIELRAEPPAALEPLLALHALRQALLGYETDAVDVEALRRGPASAGRDRLEEDALDLFADTASLFRRRASPEEGEEAESLSAGEYFLAYLRDVDSRGRSLPEAFLARVRRALAGHGVENLEPTPELHEALFWIYRAHQRAEDLVAPLVALLDRRLAAHQPGSSSFSLCLDRVIDASENRFPVLLEVAREARYELCDRPLYEAARREVMAEAEAHLQALQPDGQAADRERHVQALVECPQPLYGLLSSRFRGETSGMRQVLLEVLMRRYYRIRPLEQVRAWGHNGSVAAVAEYAHDGRRVHLVSTQAADTALAQAARDLRPLLDAVPEEHDVAVDFYVWREGELGDAETNAAWARGVLDAALFHRPVRRVVVALSGPGVGPSGLQHFTFRAGPGGFQEERVLRGFHPMIGKRLRLWRLASFDLERLPSAEDVYLFRGVGKENPRDERLFALCEVRDATPVRDADGLVVQIPHLERMLLEAIAGMRAFQARRRPDHRLHWNRILLDVGPPLPIGSDELAGLARKLGRATEGLGLEAVLLRARVPGVDGGLQDLLWTITTQGRELVVRVEPGDAGEPIRPLSEYAQKVTRMRQRGLSYPYEIVRLLTPHEQARGEIPPGSFEEHDLDSEGRLGPVDRPYGKNSANVVVGLIRNRTAKHPEGLQRVVVLGDPSREMGSIAEPECRRILAALDLAERLQVPLEWFALSAGAKISMESGTENMDWISRVLRRIVEFTQGGGEVNVVVCGINVGAQPYWNAEATMLMHTRGILVMMPESAMVLTGKTALDYSGSVSAEDNIGIGGYERIMGPNGQAQYWARDLAEACRILLRHYEHCYVAPGERFPRRASTADPVERDVRLSLHGGTDPDAFAFVGDVFSDERNPGRKHPFEIRKVMGAVVDQDQQPLERWPSMQDAETGVVWDAHLGGIPVCLVGFESRQVPRLGFVPTDGPEAWTSGTLFPRSSKKIARAINAASGSRPLVVLANLSGFDGSPESMRRLQLEYGAEIGRAVVNFRGPIVFVVISRYHGGAFVVFSRALHDNMQVAALEGTRASVIGGAPAAAVVFAREVEQRAQRDPRVSDLGQRLEAAPEAERRLLRAEQARLLREVRSEKLGEVAEEFDRIHSVERALRVGSLDAILPAASLRPWLVEALERGLAKEAARLA